MLGENERVTTSLSIEEEKSKIDSVSTGIKRKWQTAEQDKNNPWSHNNRMERSKVTFEFWNWLRWHPLYSTSNVASNIGLCCALVTVLKWLFGVGITFCCHCCLWPQFSILMLREYILQNKLMLEFYSAEAYVTYRYTRLIIH